MWHPNLTLEESTDLTQSDNGVIAGYYLLIPYMEC